MVSTAPRNTMDQLPPLDPALQSKLVAKFGAKLMKHGFTALPNLVEDHYRSVPGRKLPRLVRDRETGEAKVREVVSYMTPTEHMIMIAIWTYWWTDQNNPWPSVEKICGKVKKSERQVRRYLQRLRDKGFLLSLEQFNAEGKQISNRYDFTPFLGRLVAYLEEREKENQGSATAQDIHRGVKNVREWMPNLAGSGCQKCQGNQKEDDPDHLKEDDLDSSGSAANTRGMVMPIISTENRVAQTIGSREEETKESERISSNRNSNPPSTTGELAAGERLKEVKDNETGKACSKYEEFVLASGVPLEHLYAMETWLRQCPRPASVSLLVEGCIDEVSKLLGNGRFLISNRTQATKLYQYARMLGIKPEELDSVFCDWVYAARSHIPPNVTKKMAWFFSALKVEVLKGLMYMVPPLDLLQVESLIKEEGAEGSEQDLVFWGRARVIVLGQNDNPDLGWATPDHASWCARRLCGDIGAERYEYEILPTQYQRWGVEFRRRSDDLVEGIFLSKQEMYAFRSKARARDALLRVLSAQINSQQM